MSWLVYLLKCSDGSLYCGITNDLDARISKHNAGTGAKYTRSRLPVELLAASSTLTKGDALKLEYHIKQLPADEKLRALRNSEKREAK